MPRFKSLSDVISDAIDKQVPKIEFPSGSDLNRQIGIVPHIQNENYKFKETSFVWGLSTWGYEKIISDYKPKQE